MKATLFLILLLAAKVYAGDRVGNGGDAVVCRDSSGAIVEANALDVYEASVLRGIELKPTGANGVKEAFAVLLERLKVVSPKRAGRYEKFVKYFESNVRFVNATLVDVPDSDHLVFPAGCSVEQLIIQQIPTTTFDSRFLVQKQVWNALSIDQQATMLMHEALLQESLDGYKNYNENIETRALRFVNSLVFGVVKTAEKEWIEAFLKIPNLELVESKFFGEVLILRKLVRDENGYASQIVFNEQGEISTVILNGRMLGVLDYKINNVRFKLTSGYYTDPAQAEGLFKVTRLNGSDQVSINFLRNPLAKPTMQADGTLEFNTSCCDYIWPHMALDTKTLEVVGYKADYSYGLFSKDGSVVELPLGKFKMLVTSTHDLEAMVNAKLRVEEKRIVIDYNLFYDNDRSGGQATLITPSGQKITMLMDKKDHSLAFDLNGNNIPYIPSEPGAHAVSFVDADGKIISGTLDTTKPASENFKPSTVNIYADVMAPIIWQPLPIKFSDIRFITDAPIKVTMARKSKIYWDIPINHGHLGGFGFSRHIVGKVYGRCDTIPAGTSLDKIEQPVKYARHLSNKEWKPYKGACN